ncbi:HEPN domain-containing protein [Halohasta litorea]|uniref:HEPN domain-containing protein n=1 Tax=Halohasta litorea TaxID=869891 RepID=A0ABD6DF24_9EURY|nr:HEPN domain-containing protein [Halohasta litorea]
MFSEELLSEAIQEFLEYSYHEYRKVRHKDYEIYRASENGQMGTTRSIDVPSARELAQDPPDEVTKICPLIEALVTDDDISLIQSEIGAAKAFNRVIKETRIESDRGATEESQIDPDFWDTLRSDEATIVYIAPIIGLSFDDNVQITDDLVIRHLSEFEKELMLNTMDLGGGSVALRRAIQIGHLTHAAVYENTTTVDNGWEGGITIMSDIDQEAQDALENLKIALRLIHPEGFQMSTWHIIDKTFYPSVISSHEKHGSRASGGIEKPVLVSNPDKIVEYYQLVSEANVDEGIRVAIDRLESSYRKVSNADGVVDAVIGIEALLSSGRSGSFREVRRRAAILAGEKATYSELGRLQGLRNATVHGENTQADKEDLQQARDLLAVLLDQVITTSIQKEITRDDVIDVLDAAITKTVENQFDDLLSEFDSM